MTVSDDASAPPVKSWRIVTTASRLTTPIMTTAASTRREVTKPRAIDPFCRFTTGYTRDGGADRGQGVHGVEQAAPQHAGVAGRRW